MILRLISLLCIALFCLPFSAFSDEASAPVIKITALGDSLTAGLGLVAEDAFPAQLSRKLTGLGWHVAINNAGVSGDTTAGGLARLDWVLADHPDLVIVELGANDALRGLSPQDAYQNLDTILKKLQDQKIKIVLAGMMAPPNLGPDYRKAFNAIYPQLAKKYDIPLYPFFLDKVAGIAALNQSDSIHPTAQGVAIIVDRITPYVVQVLDSIKKSQ